MSVAELKQILNGLDDETQIVFQESNSIYVDSINDRVIKREINTHFGNNYQAYILKGYMQLGAV